jgi:hypothetical protein
MPRSVLIGRMLLALLIGLPVMTIFGVIYGLEAEDWIGLVIFTVVLAALSGVLWAVFNVRHTKTHDRRPPDR